MSAGQEFGIVGLGRMGSNLALQGLEKGLRVVGYRAKGAPEELIRAGLVEVREFQDLRHRLQRPRLILLYIPAGPVVDNTLDALAPWLEAGDVVADGGNSYWRDSVKRQRRLLDKGIHFVDLGTSGGVQGARRGAAFMAGGTREALEPLEPILRKLSATDGYVHAGPAGAGHFAKLVQNGVAYGIFQAVAEGLDLLERFDGRLDVGGILDCWRRGAVIRSWILDKLAEAYRSEGGTSHVPPYVEDTGEVNWLVNDALEMEIAVPIISQSLMQVIGSRDEQKIALRVVAMLRHGIGGHAYGPDPETAQRRISSCTEANPP